MEHFYIKTTCSSFLIFLFFSLNVSAQKGKELWTKITKENVSTSKQITRKTEPIKATYFRLSIDGLKSVLQNAPKRKEFTGVSNVIVNFPNADGSLEKYRVLEASVMHPTLQEKHSKIRSYVGQSIENPSTIIRFSVTPQGLHTMIFSSNKGVQFIDPYSKDDNSYIIYSKRDLAPMKENFICGFIDDAYYTRFNDFDLEMARNANDGKLRDFRLALASTIEYSSFHWMAAGLTAGDTEAAKKAAVLAAMVVTMTRVNGVYEKDLSITMTLIGNNEDIIFIDSDSYTNNSGRAMLGENQTEIDNTIGTANYDIGHVFSTGGAGIASFGSCVAGQKAKGVTGLTSPIGDAYDIDFVAHEIGHQFSANHTFNGDAGNCTGGSRVGSNAYEPGSGTTIMAYAGICPPQNVQNNSDAYFHQASISEIWAYVTTGSGTCAAQTATGNSAPTALAGADYTIPISTPYKLTGSSTDTDGTGSHTFTWEQYDLGDAGLPTEGDLSGGPLVRSFEGTTDPIRYIPRLADVLNSGGTSTTWEKLASVARDVNFQLTVRDNGIAGGQTDSDDMIATTVAAAGPFLVTSQASKGISWTENTMETITWNVAGTDSNDVDTANVNILLSTDGGMTFPTVLATTANDGSHDILIPDTSAPNCRIMVEAVGNIFFNVNTESFSIGDFVTSCTQYASTSNLNLAIPDNTGSAVSHMINVPDSKIIDYIKVNVDITHSYVKDLVVQIQHPNGTTVANVWNRACSREDGIDILFEDGAPAIVCPDSPPPITINGNYSPSFPLNIFSDLDAIGNWTISILDSADVDTGVLNDWYIEVCTATTLSAPEFDGLANLSISPNPNNGEFTVKLNSNSGNDINISVYDIRGRRIFDNLYGNSSNFNEVVNLNNVEPGLYIMKVLGGLKAQTKKIIIR